VILTLLIVLPLLGGLLAWVSGRRSSLLPRWIALIALCIQLLILLAVWISTPLGPGFALEINLPWIASLGISYHLGLDGLSLLLVLLTSFLGIISVAASWKGIQERVGLYHLMLLWILTAIMGIFLSLDLVLFYFFWEMMLIPLYFLIGIWGHEKRVYATVKFFIFTQASSLFMLLSILGLYFIHGQQAGTYTFDYNQLIHASLAPAAAFWLSLGFLAAFLVKLPAVPFHPWLPDAHTEAPTAGSVILAGLVLKVGAYGLLRFSVPLFPVASQILAPWLMALGVIGILYGSLQAYGQTDFKRLVAYTSISHMGYVLLGIFAWNQYALQGVVVVLLAHGISTGALFVLAGDLQDLLHTREMDRMGGLWETMPHYGGVSLLFALASLGLPGLGNFVGEFLVLVGAYQANVTLAVLATLGFIVSTVYSLWMIQRVFHGPNRNGWKLPDLTARQAVLQASLILLILWLGLYPQPVLNTARPALESLQQITAQAPRSSQPGSPAGAVETFLSRLEAQLKVKP
jgi:NADH-quinone oxidoreductase subunit M